MKRFLTFPRLAMLFGASFAVVLGGIFVLQTYWINPGARCEAKGKWYDIDSRTCATPIYIPDITGRPAGMTRAQASADKNKDLVKLEDQVNAQQRAVRAEVAREKAELAARNGN